MDIGIFKISIVCIMFRVLYLLETSSCSSIQEFVQYDAFQPH